MAVLHTHASRDEAAAALADALARQLQRGLDERGRASLVLSGGSSPRGLFEHLRRARLAWDKVTIVPSDERWVAPDHADSNEGAMRASLLRDAAADAQLLGLYRDTPSPNKALPQVARDLALLARPFDAVVLGMGEDGHTASLFPDAVNIAACLESHDDCVLPERPGAPIARISLSLSCLLDARSLNLLFFGAAKRAIYEQACRPGPAIEYPVRGVIHQNRAPPNVYWSE